MRSYIVKMPVSGFVEVRTLASSPREAKRLALAKARNHAATLDGPAVGIEEWKVSVPNRDGITVEAAKERP